MKESVLEIKINKINEKYSSWYIDKLNKEVFTIPGCYEFIDGESNRYLFYITEIKTSFSDGFKDGFIHQIFKLNINDRYRIPEIIENENVKYLQKIIDFINDKFGIEKQWRAKTNDAYFYINSVGRCDHDFECHSQFDNFRYEMGNYFKTENEVERVITSKEWKDFWNKVKNKQI